MTTFYLVRHAECEQNLPTKDFVIGGQSNHSPVTSKGYKQIDSIAHRLKDETFAAIHSSTAVRAMETADGIAKAMSYPIESILRSKELLEKHQGDWTGKPRGEIYTPEVLRRLETFDERPPSGESFTDVANRMENYLLQNLLPGKVLVVTHGNAIKSLLTKIMGGQMGISYRIHTYNTSITEIKYTDKWEIARINDASHIRK